MSNRPFLQRHAAATACIRMAEQAEHEASPFPNRTRREVERRRSITPIREEGPSMERVAPTRSTSIETRGLSKEPLWKSQNLIREPLPPNTFKLTIEEYREKAVGLDNVITKEKDPNRKLRHIIYTLVQGGIYYSWSQRNPANKRRWENLALDLYRKTGVLVSAEECLRVWTLGRRSIREKVKRYATKGLNEVAAETEFKKCPSYPYLRFIRKVFDEYDRELRKQLSGGNANVALIEEKEAEDDIIFDKEVLHGTHVMKYMNVKEEHRNAANGNAEDRNNIDDSAPGPAAQPPPSDTPRRRPAPVDEYFGGSPAKLRATTTAPVPLPVSSEEHPSYIAPELQAPQINNLLQTPPKHNTAGRLLQLQQQPLQQQIPHRSFNGEEGFGSRLTPSTSGSITPHSAASPPPLHHEGKPGLLHVDPVEVERDSWPQLVNPLNPTGIYENGLTQQDVVGQACQLLSNRLEAVFSETPYKKIFLDTLRMLADTLEQPETMSIGEVLHECQVKRRIKEKNPK